MVIHFWSYGFYLFGCPVSVIWPWVDFINGFAPLRPTFAPFAQLLRSFLLAQMLAAGRERSAQGTRDRRRAQNSLWNRPQVPLDLNRACLELKYITKIPRSSLEISRTVQACWRRLKFILAIGIHPWELLAPPVFKASTVSCVPKNKTSLRQFSNI